MNHLLPPFLILTLATSLLVGDLAAAPNSSSPASVKVGIIAPLSGPVASWGSDTRNALELANESFGDGREARWSC